MIVVWSEVKHRKESKVQGVHVKGWEMLYHEDDLGSETNSLQSDASNVESFASSDRDESLGAANEAVESPGSEFARAQDIRIDQKDRILGAGVLHDSLPIRVGLIVIGLIAFLGVAWIVSSSLGPGHVPSNPSVQIADSLAAVPDFKGDRIQPLGNDVHESIGEPNVEDKAKDFSSSASSPAKPPLRAGPPGPPIIGHSTGSRRHPSSIRVNGKEANSETQRTPVPETRPSTIEGWTVREVTNGMAALEGPNGIWRVRRGDAVPGLGRIESIVLWGRRWIVATSQGLIATP
jgi:hypothetical protein